MIITKQYLSGMIKEEMQIVLTEREITLFLENEVLPFIRGQKKLLSEQQQEILEEGIKDLFMGIKGFASKGWDGIKALFSSIIRIIDKLPIALTGASILGSVLTTTDEGKELLASTLAAVTSAMESSAEGTEYSQKVLNVGADFLNYLGLGVDKFDPQAVIEKTKIAINNVETAWMMFEQVPSQFFVMGSIAGLSAVVLKILIKAVWSKVKGSPKQSKVEKELSSLQADIAAI